MFSSLGKFIEMNILKSTIFKTSIKILLSILFGIIVFEIGLRITGIYKVYSEKLGWEYTSYYDQSFKGFYIILNPNSEIESNQKELSVKFKTNSLGMRNEEVNGEKDKNTIRILCMGDSYTEGDGANVGYEYPRQLENILRENYPNQKFEVINAGKNGSDILFVETFYTEQLVKLKPDIFIAGINSTDIDDIIVRGGIERFHEDGFTRYKKGPWYHVYYIKSHFVRFLTHVVFQRDRLFLTKNERASEEGVAKEVIAESISYMDFISKENDVKPFFVFHPIPKHSKFSKLKKESFVVENYCFKEEELRDFRTNKQFNITNICYPLTMRLAGEKIEDYAWPVNGHFNDQGYRIMAEEIFLVIKEDVEQLIAESGNR